MRGDGIDRGSDRLDPLQAFSDVDLPHVETVRALPLPLAVPLPLDLEIPTWPP
jgi:hypothetical protein